ncbi:MAG: TlpA family protein disulfide reductase [Bryobacter sp.]|jgi:thiol-disulfide isomerase/thioredoxin|nr:TlpA family protein disulfide reductase [Bryobacter sp. CoA8 C33]
MTRRGLLFSSAAGLTAQVIKTPSLKISLPGGKSMLTGSLRGNPCAVTIFKTTCPHCQASLPIMQKVINEFGPKGFKAIAVAVDQNPEPLVKEFAKTYKISFPLGWAPIADICQFMDLKPEKLYVPAMTLFDSNHKLRGRYPGGSAFFNMEEVNLRNMVEMLVKQARKV